MTASFLRRIGICALACFFCVCGIYAWQLSQIKVCSFQASFYYLVTDDLRVEAGAEFVRLEGGAGYLFEQNGREYVALNVYTNKDAGAKVCENLREQGRETQLKEIGVEKLYFLEKEDKRKADIYVLALKCLQGDISLLEGCGILLEKGETQERCKELLKTLCRQISFQAANYRNGYKAFAKLCDEIVDKIESLLKDVLYTKDVRYLLCETVDAYIDLASKFKI